MTTLLLSLLWLAVLGLLTAGVWRLYREPPRLSLTRDIAPNGFQGAHLPLQVQFHLESHRPMRFLVEDPTPRTVVPDTQPFAVGELLGQRRITVSTTLSLNKRGVYQWPGVTLRWADPLGLFWRSQTLTFPQQLEVFPATHGLLLPELLRPLLSEGGLARRMGLEDPISLRGVREYVPGDPPGRVNWRLTARHVESGSLLVREPERTAASSVTVYVDVSHGGEVFVDSAARLAASLLQEALTLNLPVATASNAGVTPSGRDATALHAALLRLAELHPSPPAPVIPATRSGGNLFILTSRPTPELIQQAMRARTTASRVVIIAIPEGFYLEPGENPRRQWVAAPDSVRELERQVGALAGAGILVYVVRGNQSILKLGA